MDATPLPIETFDLVLPHGITLSCRACGPRDAPRVLFLHGFPEAAFVWDEVMLRLGQRFRCVAPNLRGYERSSAPADVASYRVKHLVGDIVALVEQIGGAVEAIVAHDWGGAVAWNFAVQHRDRLGRLIIINSPHPATFLRELQHNPAQQAASAYMNFLCRPDAEAMLAANDFARMWSLFGSMGARDPGRPGGGWLTDELKSQYREVWRAGLAGPLNYYRASPMRPPTPADQSVMSVSFQTEFVTVRIPTLVIWAEEDVALPIELLDGLQTYVPQMRVARVPGATHWIVHERPTWVASEIERELDRSS